MSWVHLTLAGQIDSPEVAVPSNLVRRSDGGKVLYWDGITDAELNACGWFRVTTTTRPADTATQIAVRSLTVVAGVPTETWTMRSKTQAELDADRDATNKATIRQQADTALGNNRTYLAIASPTNAQVIAQVRALTQQMNGVIRLILGNFEGTN